MTMNGSNARPPRWAEALLRLLLRPQDRESVSGDLLEEYRDTIIPKLGSAADGWYVRQVGSYLLRSSWRWGALLGFAFIVRYVLDTRFPPTDYWLRATMLTYLVFGISVLSAFGASCRTRSIRAGVLISTTVASIGALLSIAGTMLMLTIWHDGATLQAWRASGGIEEALVDVPLKLVVLGLVLGLTGALFGRLAGTLLARVRQAARP
jgi:hypothetical protein